MPGINSRSKGARGERTAAELLSKWTGKKFAKTPSSGGLNWKSQHAKGDVVSTTEGFYFPFCVEVKFHLKIDFSHLLTPNIKNIEILDFWNQCNHDAKECNKIPLLLMRYNGLPSDFFYAVVTYEFFTYCIEPFYYMDGKYFRYEGNGYDLIIFSSRWLFSLPYKTHSSKYKNYARNLEEIIKPFPLSPERYNISNRGYLVDKKKGRNLYGSKNNKNCLLTSIMEPKKKTITIYRWVAKVFVKNPHNKTTVNHIKPHRIISDARNLEWVTPQENTRHYYDNIDQGYRIKKIDPKTKKTVGIYNSALNAAKSVGKDGGSSITKVLMGKRSLAYGFNWKKTI